MSFQLKPGKPLHKNVRRIVRNQLARVLKELADESNGSSDAIVHQVRKRFKRIRAIVRLVQAGMSKANYDAENKCFRDIARPFTEVRDAKILLDTLDGLREHFKDELVDGSFGALREELQKNLRSVKIQVLEKEHAFQTAKALVRDTSARIDRWIRVSDHWSALAFGLETTYSLARKAFRHAMKQPSAKRFHEWRKQVKYLGSQVEVLRPLWPERLTELHGELDQLGNLLGEDHDLAVLHEKLLAKKETPNDSHECALLISLIERRQTELQDAAQQFGHRFFADRPSEFTLRFKSYWKVWRRQTILS